MEENIMLVLSRKVGQKIMIGNDIVVTVLAQKGDCIKLGIQAPQEVSIHREEIHQRIQTESAALSPTNIDTIEMFVQS